MKHDEWYHFSTSENACHFNISGVKVCRVQNIGWITLFHKSTVKNIEKPQLIILVNTLTSIIQ